LKSILFYIFKLLVRGGFIKTSGYVIYLACRIVNPKKSLKLLCLTKPIFNDDLNEIVSIRPNLITYIYFPRLWLSEIIKIHYKNFHLLNDASYYPLLDGTEEQFAIKRDIEVLFNVLRKLLKFDAVFSGNFVYVSQQEFFKVSMEKNMPVIVLYKEGMIPIGKYDYVGSTLYKTKQFHGTRLFVYNDMIRKMLIDANILGINATNTVSVGLPRLDKYFRKNHSGNKNPLSIVLFFFETSTKANILINDTKLHKRLIERGTAFISSFIKLALKRRDIDLVIKTKNNKQTIKEMTKIINAITSDKLPSNIKVTSVEDPYSIIRRCRYVAGYTSTTLLEGMVLDKVILCPDFSDILNSNESDYFGHYPYVVNYISDYYQLEQIFDKSPIINMPDESTKKEILEKYLYSVDGASADRVYKGILNCVNESKNS